MQRFMLFLIFASMTFDYLAGRKLLPGFAPYIVEVMGAIALLYVVAMGVRDQFRNVRPVYLIVFGGLILCMICGVFVNREDPGPIFAGFRTYFRAVPMFFLPAVYAFTDKQLRTQLKLLLVLTVAQLPFAAYQRMHWVARGGQTGDTTYGTLMISSILSIFLICAVSVLVALYIRKRISGRNFLLLFLCFLIPTTINETKGTLFLMPIALITTFLIGSRPGTRAKNTVLALGITAVFAGIFIPVYNNLIQLRKYPTTIQDFFTQPGRAAGYLASDSPKVGVGGTDARRMDTITVPLRFLKSDPAKVIFGLGIGNASRSSLGPQFTGPYNPALNAFLFTSVGLILSELGLAGVALVLVLHWLVLRDSQAVAAMDDGPTGAFALGWTGVTVIMTVGLLYKNLLPFSALSYLFWFYSGVIAAQRMRLTLKRREELAKHRVARFAGHA